MSTVCCKGYPDSDPRDLAKSQGWPLTAVEYLQWISFNRQNSTEIRPFMCPKYEGRLPISLGGAMLSPYKVVNPQASQEEWKVDLNAWEPDFWAYIDGLLTDAARRGVYVMVGVIDTWPQDHVSMTIPVVWRM